MNKQEMTEDLVEDYINAAFNRLAAYGVADEVLRDVAFQHAVASVFQATAATLGEEPTTDEFVQAFEDCAGDFFNHAQVSLEASNMQWNLAVQQDDQDQRQENLDLLQSLVMENLTVLIPFAAVHLYDDEEFADDVHTVFVVGLADSIVEKYFASVEQEIGQSEARKTSNALLKTLSGHLVSGFLILAEKIAQATRTPENVARVMLKSARLAYRNIKLVGGEDALPADPEPVFTYLVRLWTEELAANDSKELADAAVQVLSDELVKDWLYQDA